MTLVPAGGQLLKAVPPRGRGWSKRGLGKTVEVLHNLSALPGAAYIVRAESSHRVRIRLSSAPTYDQLRIRTEPPCAPYRLTALACALARHGAGVYDYRIRTLFEAHRHMSRALSKTAHRLALILIYLASQCQKCHSHKSESP